ncbi:MAG: HAD-IB family phosphatase [Leptospirales bacterium]|nr:HAD-IB family phosphatase [Leptospirales bacterium]
MAASAKAERRPLALFDLDFTLLPHDTIFLFANYSLKKRGGRIVFLFLALLYSALHLLRLRSLLQLKSAFLSHLHGLHPTELQQLARDFVRDEVVMRLYPRAAQELQELKQSGYALVLNTASPDIYVESIAEALGFDYYYATAVELVDPLPRLPLVTGPNNKREQKLLAMAAQFPQIAQHAARSPSTPLAARAYSDSSADLPMLQLASEATLVNPSPGFAELGAKSGWTIWRLPTPYSSTAGKLWMFLRQMCGIY